MRRERPVPVILKLLRLFGREVGQHLNQFGNLVRQHVPEADDTVIRRVLLQLHWAGRVVLSKFVRCGPFYHVNGLIAQGGKFYVYDEWPESDDFFRGEFRVGLAS